jgi:iron complex outermembrane receptor protein/vitamin B12 transporter
MRRILLATALLAAASPAARAVVVRGKVTTPLGAPLAGARVQLIRGPRSVADTISGPDGTYEIRTSFAGRFVLLTAPSILSPGFAPQVSAPFYGSRASSITIDIALNNAGITPRVSAQQTGIVTPNKQLATPFTQIPAESLLTQVTAVPELFPIPGSIVVQYGQIGAPAELYLRGAPPRTMLTTIDGVTANPLGEGFNFSTLSTTALAAVSPVPALEPMPTANPLALTGASGGDLSIAPIRATADGPTLTYIGDAGPFGALHNAAVATYTRGRVDLLGAFSRFDISNATPDELFHLIAWAGEADYHVSAGTSLRAVARYDESAAALPSPFDLFRVDPDGKQATQNLFARATFDTVTASQWRNAVGYGMGRERGQTYDFFTPATGLPVTLAGANGYKAAGVAAFDPLPSREDRVTNRDELSWLTTYPAKSWLALTGEFRFQDERAADILPAGKTDLGRTHTSAALGLGGDVRHRLFYQASGLFDYSSLLGFTGSPRAGLTYAPVSPGAKIFRGTSLHATAATGTRDPSLLEQAAVPKGLAAPRSRTFDLSVDQNILGQKLTLRGTYFHSQFAHEFEPIALGPIASQPVLSQTLALRTQGFESELRYQPFQRVLLEGGYSYLAALTERSAETPSFNPAYPSIAIGGLTALAGQRPFHRPPQSAFLLAEYSGRSLNASLKGALASRSDSSTGLPQTPALLLPNRNLSPGYTSLDGNLSFAVTKRVAVFTQLTNLTDNRHIAPFGYLSTPFLIRAGLRVRLGGE